ncbi:MAG: restriction endonuclease [Candidatus Thiodiazotropha endolucinida]|uniref:Restriction endonuclease n=1 Tax=Candidatus Thiodiazotropha taylori TaxID=2792791 RepID=A0A9E4NMX6_9GAMM|nr:restriction endonuclease [Candidatus Thiodiazotropha taylori]MCW4238416.1 restriction endonuclease [Candidatus Thiodiazotropha endolucinida]
MTIPKYDELMPGVLEYLSENGLTRYRDLEAPLAHDFGLDDKEVTKEYESGNGKIFLDRISWALSYLALSGLVVRPKRGYCDITDLGKMYLGKSDEIKQFVKQKITERQESMKAGAFKEEVTLSENDVLSGVTPLEALEQAYYDIKSTTYETIIDAILSKSPYEFEKLVVKLLGKMGYGGKVKDAAQVTQSTNDKGIDGIIKEDVLGLGKIHIQAKRYARDNSVGREEIQKFVGALAVAESNKGVFITTSNYSKGAQDYVNSLHGSTNVVLIDGEMLAEFIYTYSLGMQVEKIVEIKKLDADFWDAMQEG